MGHPFYPALRFLLSVSAVVAAVRACTTDDGCSLNGVCKNGACACVAPWKGADCSALDVLPAAAPDGAFYRRANTSSWCASALRDNDTSLWHSVVSVFADHCGLDSWVVNSELVHAIAARAEGPYAPAGVIRLPFAHNPKLVRAPDGTLLVFHIGCGDNATHRYGPCTGGVTPAPPPPPSVRFLNSGGCLAPANGTYPAWVSPSNQSFSPLTLERGAACNSSSSGWLLDHANNRWYAAQWPAARAFVDCSSCVVGAALALVGPGARSGGGAGSGSSGATGGLVYNASAGTIEVGGCAGMCLSNGCGGAVQPHCSGAGEPWLPQQLHVVPCASAAATGWVQERVKGGLEALERAAEEPPLGQAAARLRVLSDAPTCGGSFTELLSAASFDGPWVFETAFGPAADGTQWPFSVDNPAPLFLSDGSIGVMFRSYAAYNSTIGIAHAPSWRGPWTLPTAPIFYGHAEDPTWWYSSATRSYHALFHGLGACGTGAAGVGCHAFSRDGVAWTLSPTPAYSLDVKFDDGSHITFARRERPQLLFDPVTGEPTHLVNGVQPPGPLQPTGGRGDASYTLVVPLRVGA